MIVSTFSDLQSAIFAGERSIEISGSISAPEQNLTITQPDRLGNGPITHIRGGVLKCASVTLDGFRSVKLSEIELRANVRVRNGIRLFIEDSYIAATGDLLRLETIAGTWLRGVHFNPLAESTDVCVRVGDSVLGYEALHSEACLFEKGHTAFMCGGSGNIVQFWSIGDKFDRQVSAAFLFRPEGASSVRNVLIDNYWINGSDYGVVLNVLNTTGRIDRVKVTPNGHYLRNGDRMIATVFGDDSRVTRDIQHPMYGPLEPGS